MIKVNFLLVTDDGVKNGGYGLFNGTEIIIHGRNCATSEHSAQSINTKPIRYTANKFNIKDNNYVIAYSHNSLRMMTTKELQDLSGLIERCNISPIELD